MNKEKQIIYFADLLYNAQITRESIGPITAASQDIDIDDAYAIQLKNVEKQLASGAKISGKKIGLTSVAMQEMLGVNEPDYGHLYDTMDYKDGKVPIDTLMQPKVEGEIAFILKEDVKGPNAKPEDVIAATDYIVAALEIVDSRVKDWKIKLVDTVSDNASSGCYVLSKNKIKPTDIDLPEVKMDLYKNGEKINAGAGKDVLGNPAYCVSWLANKMYNYGVTLKKGEVVLSGALSAAIEVRKGDIIKAKFSELGSVSAKFV